MSVVNRERDGQGKEVLSAEFWVLSWQIRNVKCGMMNELDRRDEKEVLSAGFWVLS